MSSSDKSVPQDVQGIAQDNNGSGLSIIMKDKLDNDAMKLGLGSSSSLYSHDSGGSSALDQPGAGSKGKMVQMVIPTSNPNPSNSCKSEAEPSWASGSYSGDFGLHLGPSVGTSSPWKRKAIEGSSGQSSLSCPLEMNKNTGHVVTTHLNASTIATPLLSRHDPRIRCDTWRGPKPSSVGAALVHESASGTPNWRMNLSDQHTLPYYSVSTQSAPLHSNYLPNTIVSPLPFSSHNVARQPYETIPSGLAPISASTSTSQSGPRLTFSPGPGPLWVCQPNHSMVGQQTSSEFAPLPFAPSYDSDLSLNLLDFSPLPSALPSLWSDWMAAGHNEQGFNQFIPLPGISLNMQQHTPYQFLPPVEPIIAEGRQRILSQDHIRIDPIVLQGINMHTEYGRVELDIDHMSYEQLLELGDRIGVVESGLTETKILEILKRKTYGTSPSRRPLKEEPCCICMDEFEAGEDVGTLNCGHEFHTHCIKHWLKKKNLCPICKERALDV